MEIKKLGYYFFAFLLLSGCSNDQKVFKRYGMEPLHFPSTLTGFTDYVSEDAYPKLTFNFPASIVFHAESGTNRAYVVEWPGRVVRFLDVAEASATEVYLDIQDRVGFGEAEEGLFSIAFSPQFETEPYFWAAYAGKDGHRRLVIEQFSENQSTHVVSSSGIVKIIETTTGDHKGGLLMFDTGGHLYIGVGDGGPQGDPEGHAQNLFSLRGKILRINPEPLSASYSIPVDNPFVGLVDHQEEIWAYGFRHPWRFSFDRANGDLWVGDVGLNDWEEIDWVQKGENYGWNVYEGNHDYIIPSPNPAASAIAPVYDYNHSLDVGTSIIGGYVYRGSEWPELYSQYIYADYISGNIFALKLDNHQAVSNRKIANIPNVSSISETPDGELRFVSLGLGKIFKLRKRGEADNVLPKKLSETGIFSNTEKKLLNPGLFGYEVNMPLWSDGLYKRRWVGIPNGQKIAFKDSGREFPEQTVFVKSFYATAETYQDDNPLETRIFIRLADDWHGFAYRWDEDKKDATLIDQNTVIHVNGSDWLLPGPDQCLQCHTKVTDRVLGFKPEQLNLKREFPFGSANQLKVMGDNGFLDALDDATMQKSYPKLDDESATPELKVKAYLDSNCSHCHQFKGSAPTYMDFRFEIPVAKMGIVNVVPSYADFGWSDAKIVSPGHHEKSVLWKRVGALDGSRMPLLGSAKRDEKFIQLLETWIDSL